MNPFATDIASSFIAAFVPPDEVPQASSLINQLRRLHERIPGGVHLIIMLHREPEAPPPPEIADFLSAFAGRRNEAAFRLTSALVKVTNAPYAGQSSIDIDITY